MIQHRTTVLSTERLVELMAIEPFSPYQDRDDVLRRGHTMSQSSLGRGRYILVTPQFQQLLSAPSCSVLLVDGHCQDECDGKVSPISVFCASLAATLAHNPSLMVLHFFAGQHSFFDDDPVRGPHGLMRSLICQVLLYPNQPSPSLEQVSDQVVQDIADGNINALCWLFKELLKRVVNVTTILCIVDSVSDFEKDWVEELKIVFNGFRSLPDELNPGVNLKLLMTNAGKSTELVYETDQSEHLSLVAGNVMNVGKSEWAMTQDIDNSVPSQDNYWREGPGY